ncbi:tescalcin a isoform X3 [Phyllopteryx taeniolatus]|uniref:tescalcin a isoform X3 n=1 Tax=Phyllopteryx taeniolatus TaxID=161469 RepID=UPI002AD4AD91|nr:tescalcin a isoform X3 [Phyllopteryx taeniolatus]
MGSWQARPERQQRYEELAHKTGFSTEQIKNLHKRFRQLSGNEETMSRANLDSIPALANNPIKKQIIDAFFDKRNQQQEDAAVGSVEEISLEQFLMVMSHFRPPEHKSSEEERQAIRKRKLRCGGGAAVQKRCHRARGGQGHRRRGHVGSGQHQRAAHGNHTPAPDEFYEGITFEHFEQILKGLEMESRMHIRFLDVDTTTMRCGKATA